MQSRADEHPAATFLKTLYQNCSEGFINLRFLPSGKNLFISLEEINSIPSILDIHKAKNAFFGVSLRRRGDGTKQGIIEIPALWVDIDLEGLAEEKKEKIRQQYRESPLKPTFVVNSGGGLHSYWRLKESISSEGIPLLEDCLKRLASYFNGDMSSTDASRILRIPGTFNYKYSPPREVIIKKFNPEVEYNLDDFEIFPQLESLPAQDEKPRLPEGWEKELLDGVAEGQRNNAIARLAGRYLGKGLSKEESFPILMDANSRFNPPLPREEIEIVLNSIIKTRQRNQSNEDTGRGNQSKSVEIYYDTVSCRESTKISNRIETLRDLLNKEVIPRDPIIGDGLIARKDFVIFSGPQKKGKSLASLNLAIRIAQGQPWLGFEVPVPRRVGIIQQEIPEESLKKRLEMMLKNVQERNFLDRVPQLTSRGLKLDSKQKVEEICRWLDMAKIDLVVFDPLYLFHNKRENDPGDMSKICEALQNIAQDYNCGIIVIHHHGKPSQMEREGGDLHRGTSLLRDATDANWTFTRVPQNKYQLDDLPSRYSLFSFEQRHTLNPDPILIRLNPETLWLELVEAKGRQEIKTEEVTTCLTEHGGEMSAEDLKLALMNKLRMGDRACREGIYKARDEGKIIASSTGEGRGKKRSWKIPDGLKTRQEPKVADVLPTG